MDDHCGLSAIVQNLSFMLRLRGDWREKRRGELRCHMLSWACKLGTCTYLRLSCGDEVIILGIEYFLHPDGMAGCGDIFRVTAPTCLRQVCWRENKETDCMIYFYNLTDANGIITKRHGDLEDLHMARSHVYMQRHRGKVPSLTSRSQDSVDAAMEVSMRRD